MSGMTRPGPEDLQCVQETLGLAFDETFLSRIISSHLHTSGQILFCGQGSYSDN